MTDGTGRSTGLDEEAATVRLLRAAGPRAPVSTDRAARVRSAVQLEWRIRRRRRSVFRRTAFAAAIVSAAVLLFFTAPTTPPDRLVAPPAEPIAVVEAVTGADGIRRADPIRAGQWVETGPGARLALRFAGDTSVRLDLDSRMRVLSSKVIELSTGALYVDTGQEHGSVEIRTSLGTVRDVGTQFEVRLVEGSLRLRVRTGTVELRDRTRSISGQPGTEIMFSAASAVTRPIAPHSPEWAWVADVAPPIEMEGVPLAAFLQRVAREQGWTVEYPDAAVARRAETIILHGSVRDLTPYEAVDVAISASGLRHRVAGGSVIVARGDVPPAERLGNMR